MPTLQLNPADLLTGTPTELAGERWIITGTPAASPGLYVPVAQSGNLDDSGTATITLQESPTGTWLIFGLPQREVRWPFLMGDADTDLRTQVTAYRLPDPVGPTPGPTGPPGAMGADGETPPYPVNVFRNDTAPPALPAGSAAGTFNADIGAIVTPPTGWTVGTTVPATGEETYVITATIPLGASGVIVPVWFGPGISGGVGPTGMRGADGAAGPAGAAGADGAMGADGAAGQDGAVGAAGAAGAAGAQGDQGDQGVRGDTGSQGPRGNTGVQGPIGPIGPIGPEGPAGTGGGGVVTSSVWTLLYEAGAGVNDRLDTGSATVRQATYTLETGETFSGYDELACWIDNSSGREAKFMYLLVSHFITTLGTAGNWVDWSDNRWCGVSYRSDTTFQVVGNGMGIRRIYGRAAPGGATGATGAAGADGSDGAMGAQGNTGPRGATGNTGPTGPTGPAGSGGALTAAAITSLSEGAAHTTSQVPGTDAAGLLKKFSFSEIIDLTKSSAGIGSRLPPEPTAAHVGQVAVVNRDADGFDYHDLPGGGHVGVLSRLPSHPATRSDRFVIIPTLYHAGVPVAFQLTVGFDVPICGYSRLGGDNLGSVVFNSPEVEAPFSRLIGQAASTQDWGLDDSITFPSRDTADEFTEIDIAGTRYNLLPVYYESGWTRRIQNGPRFPGGNLVAVNLYRADGSAFDNAAGVATAVKAGLWEYVYDDGTGTEGKWFRHVPEALIHVDVIGDPVGMPSPDEYLVVNRDGSVYPVRRVVSSTSVNATASSSAFTDPKYDRSPDSLATLFTAVGAWGFFFPNDGSGRATQSGAALGMRTTGVEWADVWQNILDGVSGMTPERTMLVTRYRDDEYLGVHTSDAAAALHMTRLGISTALFPSKNYYYFRHISAHDFGLRHVTAYTAGSTVEVETRSYGGRLATHAEVVAGDQEGFTGTALVNGDIALTPNSTWAGSGVTLVAGQYYWVQVNTHDSYSTGIIGLRADDLIAFGGGEGFGPTAGGGVSNDARMRLANAIGLSATATNELLVCVQSNGRVGTGTLAVWDA